MPKNAPTIVQLHSFHTLGKVILKILQARLQKVCEPRTSIFKLDLEKAEELEIKLPISVG